MIYQNSKNKDKKMSEKYNNKIIDTIIENVDEIETDEKKEIIQKIVSLEIKQKKIQKKN